MTDTQPACQCEAETPSPGGDAPIACSLGAQDVPQRVSDWQGVATQATERITTATGLRLTFPPSPGLAAQIAGLAAAETQCCAFFRMTLTMASDELALDVGCPADARPILDELLG